MNLFFRLSKRLRLYLTAIKKWRKLPACDERKLHKSRRQRKRQARSLPHLFFSLIVLICSGCQPSTPAADISADAIAEQNPSEPNRSEHTFTQVHMAMPVRVTVWATDAQQARLAGHAAFDRISQLVATLSSYRSDSELNQLVSDQGRDFSTDPRMVSKDLISVLTYADKIYHLTGGALDPTAGPLIELWKDARATKVVPARSSITSAIKSVGFDNLKIDTENRQVQLLRPNLQLDLGALGKGYIADQALLEITKAGIESACIEAGGDFVVSDAPPGTAGWEIEVPLMGTKYLKNCGISVSGDTMQFAEIDSVRYSHVVDPRTGYALTNRIMAIVIAPTAMQSDALATAACVMDETEFDLVVKNMQGVEFWRLQLDKDQVPLPAGDQ